jgi:translation initiation factor 5B
MAPKKGKKKVQDDDWEAELGESIVPQNQPDAAADPKPEEAGADDDAMGGGLMAALQRRGKKKGKKGANVDVEGEDPAAAQPDAPPADSFEDKAPQEANFDDDDVFAGNYGKKKAKGGAAAADKAEAPATPPADDTPRVKTKAEKEREKKEKEKQRKKELVSGRVVSRQDDRLTRHTGCKEEEQRPRKG